MRMLKFPLFRQTKSYDCGAITTQMVLAYFGINIRGDIIIKEVKTNKSGTKIENIIKVLKKYKLKYKAGQSDIKNLKKFLKENKPIIIPLQAWTNKKEINWQNDWSDGHYVVAIGYDKNKIYFADPSSIYKTYLTYTDLEKRWHDISVDGKKYIHFGIAVSGKRKYTRHKIIHID